MPIGVLTPDDEPVECSSFECLLQKFCHVLEMVQRFVIQAAFGVTGIVTRKSIAATATRQGPEKGLLLPDLIEMQIEEPGAVTIHKSHPLARLSAQQHSEFLQMEAAVDEQLSLRQLWRKIE